MAHASRVPVLPGSPSFLLHRERLMESGWIKLHRKAKLSQVFKNAHLWQIWSWCLLEATHTEVWIPVKTGRGITEVHLLPGQFIFGRESAAKELRMKPSTLWKRMLKLKNIENLNIESSSKYSIITLANWGLYQDPPEKVTAKVTAREQPSNTNKNDKNKVSKDTCRSKKTTDPNVRSFILEWNESFSKKFNQTYMPNWAKEGKLTKDMLRVHGIDKLRELRKAFFSSQDSFIKNSDYSIGAFKANLNRIIVELATDPFEQAKREMGRE